jgi:hypothetical protein
MGFKNLPDRHLAKSWKPRGTIMGDSWRHRSLSSCPLLDQLTNGQRPMSSQDRPSYCGILARNIRDPQMKYARPDSAWPKWPDCGTVSYPRAFDFGGSNVCGMAGSSLLFLKAPPIGSPKSPWPFEAAHARVSDVVESRRAAPIVHRYFLFVPQCWGLDGAIVFVRNGCIRNVLVCCCGRVPRLCHYV